MTKASPASDSRKRLSPVSASIVSVRFACARMRRTVAESTGDSALRAAAAVGDISRHTHAPASMTITPSVARRKRGASLCSANFHHRFSE